MASGISFSLGGAAPPSSPAAKPAHHQNGTSKPTNGSASKPTNGTKRPHASLGDDSDNDDSAPAKQVVTHFGSRGAVNARAPKAQEKGPLVIAAQANRDWRDAAAAAKMAKRARYGVPEDERKDAREQEEEIRRIEEAKKPVWGLNVTRRGEVEAEDSGEAQAEEQEKSTNGNGIDGSNGHREEGEAEPKRPRTDDERAMDALLGIKQQSDMTIPAVSEEEAFKMDYKEAPPMATLEQYAAVPVEEFGAALLRGMGWKEGHGIGNQRGQKIQKSKVPERRPALLGIGAKEDAAVKEEMGAWGRGAKKRSEVIYNPVVMRNKQTGEELTEEEVKQRMEQQEVKDRDANLDAAAKKRKDEYEAKHKKGGRRYDDDSDEEYERRRRERRREKERYEKECDRRERRRSGDRDDRRDRDKTSGRNRDYRRERDDRDKPRRRDDRDRKDDRYEDDRRRRR